MELEGFLLGLSRRPPFLVVIDDVRLFTGLHAPNGLHRLGLGRFQNRNRGLGLLNLALFFFEAEVGLAALLNALASRALFPANRGRGDRFTHLLGAVADALDPRAGAMNKRVRGAAKQSTHPLTEAHRKAQAVAHALSGDGQHGPGRYARQRENADRQQERRKHERPGRSKEKSQRPGTMGAVPAGFDPGHRFGCEVVEQRRNQRDGRDQHERTDPESREQSG